MKSESIFDYVPTVNKNTEEFDIFILEQLKKIAVHPAKFESAVRKIMRQKSSCKLWWDNKPTKMWNYETKSYQEVNYRCCPSSHKANNYFCLVLKRTENLITVEHGFLSAV